MVHKASFGTGDLFSFPPTFKKSNMKKLIYILTIVLLASCEKSVEFKPPTLTASVVRNGGAWYNEINISDSIGSGLTAKVSWISYDTIQKKNVPMSIDIYLPASHKRAGVFSYDARGNIRSIDVKIDTVILDDKRFTVKY